MAIIESNKKYSIIEKGIQLVGQYLEGDVKEDEADEIDSLISKSSIHAIGIDIDGSKNNFYSMVDIKNWLNYPTERNNYNPARYSMQYLNTPVSTDPARLLVGGVFYDNENKWVEFFPNIRESSNSVGWYYSEEKRTIENDNLGIAIILDLYGGVGGYKVSGNVDFVSGYYSLQLSNPSIEKLETGLFELAVDTKADWCNLYKKHLRIQKFKFLILFLDEKCDKHEKIDVISRRVSPLPFDI
jgi:hypothetical protein